MALGQGGFDECFRTNMDRLQQTILKILDIQHNAAEVTMKIKKTCLYKMLEGKSSSYDIK